MLRLALWLVIIFIVWKAMRISVSIGRRSRESHAPNTPPFSNIEDAEFEDLSQKQQPPSPPPAGNQQPPQ